MIIFNKEKKQFHLSNNNMSYVMEIIENKYLVHVYNGKKIQEFCQQNVYPQNGRSSFSPNPKELESGKFSYDLWPQEYSASGAGDYRETAFNATYPDGTQATSLTYKSHKILAGKPELEGLPQVYVEDKDEASTLVVTLEDIYREIEVDLNYTIYHDRDVLARSAKVRNISKENMKLERILSANFDFPHMNYDVIQLPGTWAKEKQLKRSPLSHGIFKLDSKRGASSSAQQPFMALATSNTTDFSGEAHGFHFIYSGNFKIVTEVDIFEQTRVLLGINDYQFNWTLKPGECFQAPEMVYVYSDKGLNHMSQTFHSLYRERLVRGKFRDQERPILTNNWETTYFDFNEEKLLDLAENAKNLGVELFVLDDGWFGKRNDDTTSLGDWNVDTSKLPKGLKNLSVKIKEKGLKFGLWFEPEMISPVSDLFKKHPDWHLHINEFPSSLARNQYVLDFSRQEVRDYIFDKMTTILDEVPVDYIKWDFNRNLTEVASVGRLAENQQETTHRYYLGLYDFLEKLIARYPDILFENCSGGGGRFDPGMAYYMPQSWTSDNTDAVDRMKIQYGNSLVYPTIMTCAQLSDVPNHQLNRITDLETRALVAMSANFGVMLDLDKKTKAELEAVKPFIEWYKENRSTIQFGDFYRLMSPFDTNYASWLIVDKEQEIALLYFFQILSNVSHPHIRLQLTGLQENAFYEVDGQLISGEELMNYGLYMNGDLSGDFKGKVLTIRRK